MKLLAKTMRLVAFTTLTLTLTLSSGFFSRSIDRSNFGDAQASAALPRFRIIHYYSDANRTNHVGTGIFYCNGRSTLSGRSTPYSKEMVNEPCCLRGETWETC
jgi:hypothetical protein